MNDTLMWLYYRLPAPLRSVAVGLWGFQLRAWRYGPETEKLVEEALEREGWTPQRWRSWQEEQLAHLLYRAATRVPYYREQWATRRRHGDRASWEYLENWPILGKQTLRENPRAFVADDCDIRKMYPEHTAGTTGTPLDLWFSRETVRAWHALFELRARRWNGVGRHDRWGTLGGKIVISPKTQRPPFWVWNAPMNQLYLSATHIKVPNIRAYMTALAHYNLTHLVSYPSSASLLARETLNLNLSPLGLKVVITVAEPVFPWQRQVIQQGFGSDVRETYGMAEIVAAASECSAGTLHLWPEVGWLEVLSDAEDAPLQPGASGRLICTSLLNVDMPLIRYAVGDRGGITPEGITCRCSRTLPALAGIEGRSNDLLISQDGRQIYLPLNRILFHLPVQEAQVIQERLDQMRIRYVPAPECTIKTEHLIIDRLQARMGEVKVIVERVNEVPRTANGKFQAVICGIPPEEREELRQMHNRTVVPS